MKFMKCILFSSLLFVSSFSLAQEKSALEIAAEQGNVEAQHQLGWDYVNMARNVRNESGAYEFLQWIKYVQQAEFWFKKAANQGYDRSQVILAEIYIIKFGFSMAVTDARRLSDKANFRDEFKREFSGELNYSDYLLEFVYNTLSQPEGNFKDSIYWAEEAASQGNPEIQFQASSIFLGKIRNLGLIGEVGEKGLEEINNKALLRKAKHRALVWLKQSADQGYPQAVDLLNEINSKE